MATKPVTTVTKPKPTPAQFVQQVRQEIAKVTWPSRKEVIVTTIMVFAMALMMTVFLLVVDVLIQKGITGLFSLAA